VKENFPSKFGFSSTSKNSAQFLQSSLRPELFPTLPVHTVLSDSLALNYLFGMLSKEENRHFPSALYYRLTEVAASQLLGTLPELLLQPMLSQLCDGFCSLAYSLSLVIVFLVKFGKPVNEHPYSAALISCAQHFLTLTRIAELLGLQSNHLYKDYLTVLATVIPDFLDQPQAGLDGLLRLGTSNTSDHTVYGSLWSYTYSCKPWMPDTYAVYSTRDIVGFNLVKADRLMNMVQHADSRMLLRWCGLDLPLSEPSDLDALVAQSPLFHSLLDEAHRYPDRLVSRKLMASLLFLTAETQSRFYTASVHRKYVERVLKEEVQEPTPQTDQDETSGWDSLDLEISEI
jgi:hypothetical protein